MTSVEERFKRLNSILNDQQETITHQQATIRRPHGRIAVLEAGSDDNDQQETLPAVGLWGALTAAGLFVLLFGSVGTPSADAQGQVGTSAAPLQAPYTAALNGAVTDEQPFNSLLGSGLTAQDGKLTNTVTVRFAGGSGTASDPYRIASWKHFDNVRYEPVSGFVLAAALDESTVGYAAVASGTGGDGFDPVGLVEAQFSGSFASNDYTISGVMIDRGSENFVGLFGQTSSGATLPNVALENATVIGSGFAGGLVRGTNATVSQSSATGSVSGPSDVGGLVAVNRDGVDSSYWDTESTSQDGSSGGTGRTTAQIQGDETEDNMPFGFNNTWATVDASDADVSVDGSPVLQALDRVTQLEVRG